MRDIEHPDVTRAQITGYPKVLMATQPKHCGTDIYDSEILAGDAIIVLPNGEIVLEENLEDYLIEHLGFQFKTAK
ncbi:hypothetical protein IIE26_05015 [Cytobacillus oceanisediminis]|uniref:YqaI family protein n=1 Tax=Cytobacillus oceanisediminis TaxID=665099 RepID=UPI001864571E|nr:hypothetical protein [Cytobacillus oceanisediminis]QOK28034.1 hypothetical protein IIE26_05015 [Cytobacillus oceanisediminis]